MKGHCQRSGLIYRLCVKLLNYFRIDHFQMFCLDTGNLQSKDLREVTYKLLVTLSYFLLSYWSIPIKIKDVSLQSRYWCIDMIQNWLSRDSWNISAYQRYIWSFLYITRCIFVTQNICNIKVFVNHFSVFNQKFF